MCKVIGFALFWVGVGIIIGLILDNLFVAIVLILLLMLLGYNLFCGCK